MGDFHFPHPVSGGSKPSAALNSSIPRKISAADRNAGLAGSVGRRICSVNFNSNRLPALPVVPDQILQIRIACGEVICTAR